MEKEWPPGTGNLAAVTKTSIQGKKEKKMCGIMGYVGKGDDRDTELALALFSVISVRGTDAAGYFADGVVRKDNISSWKMALQRKTRKDWDGAKVILGHARFATHGSPKYNENNHPFKAGKFVLIHNGVIHTKPAGIHLESKCDSEVIIRLIERAGGVKEARSDVFGLVGSFAVLCYDGQYVWFMRNGGSPGCYIERDGGIFVASTPAIMKAAAKLACQDIPEPKALESHELYRVLN